MSTISWDDFEKIEIHAGTIIDARDFPNARRSAYQLSIDFGDEIGIKRSSAQITKHYKKDELVGRQILAVINFQPKQIANFMSECLVLGLYDENNDVVLIQPERPIINGSKLG